MEEKAHHKVRVVGAIMLAILVLALLLVPTILADESDTTLAYDPVGNLVSRLDADNKLTSFDYDALNRLSSTTRPGDVVTVRGHDVGLTLLGLGDIVRVLEADLPGAAFQNRKDMLHR